MIIPTFGLNTLHAAHRTPLRGLCVCALFVAAAQAEHVAHCAVCAGCAAREAGNSEGQMEQRPRSIDRALAAPAIGAMSQRENEAKEGKRGARKT
jgi:hypothetical protein